MKMPMTAVKKSPEDEIARLKSIIAMLTDSKGCSDSEDPSEETAEGEPQKVKSEIPEELAEGESEDMAGDDEEEEVVPAGKKGLFGGKGSKAIVMLAMGKRK